MRFLAVLCTLALLGGAALPAQTPAQPPEDPQMQTTPAPRGETARAHEVAAGTEIMATLDSRLSSKTSQQGDRFTATVAQDVRAADGSVAIPAGSRIEGEVAQVEEGKTLPAIRGGARLNLRFRQVVTPDGKTTPIVATLLSVHDTKGAERAQTDEEGEVRGRTRPEDVARDVGIGAAAGTVVGVLFGKAMRGLAIGAAAGGGYVLATRGRDVELPGNTGLRLRLDQNLTPPGR